MKKENLVQEAEEFAKAKYIKKYAGDERVAFRFYLGNALSGLLARGAGGRPDEIAELAVDYAVAALKQEKKN